MIKVSHLTLFNKLSILNPFKALTVIINLSKSKSEIDSLNGFIIDLILL